eukprot:TRINITY_DN270_c0_g2_i6.p1 TRINITY_DN270_c0_g2~~TRINITY_DN270_c0_g2_i6.p1  ORF type:complete len:217 (-),score=35.31 TRINITY_DN270_c0_g2_i6:229-879(-)
MFFFLRSSIGFVIKSVSIGFGCFKTFSYVEGKQVVGPGWSVFVPKPPGQQPQALPEGPQNQNGAEEQEQEKQRMMEQTRQGLFLFWIVVATAHVLGLIADCASNKLILVPEVKSIFYLLLLASPFHTAKWFYDRVMVPFLHLLHALLHVIHVNSEVAHKRISIMCARGSAHVLRFAIKWVARIHAIPKEEEDKAEKVIHNLLHHPKGVLRLHHTEQ